MFGWGLEVIAAKLFHCILAFRLQPANREGAYNIAVNLGGKDRNGRLKVFVDMRVRLRTFAVVTRLEANAMTVVGVIAIASYFIRMRRGFPQSELWRLLESVLCLP